MQITKINNNFIIFSIHLFLLLLLNPTLSDDHSTSRLLRLYHSIRDLNKHDANANNNKPVAKLLSNSQIQKLGSKSLENQSLFNSTLDAILVERTPGSAGHKRVQTFIKQMMKSLEWTVEEDDFMADTPLGKRRFNNIIATLNPLSCRRLVLACHYDSKMNRERTFLGATDSAVPCAMIIHLAQMLDTYLKAHRKNNGTNTTLQLIFFDGEEAFQQWTNQDSLYGSKHLAEKWSRKHFPATNEERSRCENENVRNGDKPLRNYLDRIEVLVLLDLIGSANPNFYSYFPDTNPLFERLIDIERKLNDLNVVKSKRRTSYFNTEKPFGLIEDDHIPFLRRGVPIVHIIPSPFPKVWHRESDNAKNLHHNTIHNLLKVFQVFLSEYLNLDIDY